MISKVVHLNDPIVFQLPDPDFLLLKKFKYFSYFHSRFKYHDIEEWVDQLFYRRIQVTKRVKNSSYLIKLRKPTLGKVEDIGSHVDRAKTPATI